MPPAIPQSDLVTFNALPDGNLEAVLQRFGRLLVRLPNSAQTIEISVRRDAKKNFCCFVATSVSGDERQVAAAGKANGGVRPEINHILGVDGRLNPTPDHESKTQRNKSTGRKAAAADSAGGGGGDTETGRGGDGNAGGDAGNIEQRQLGDGGGGGDTETGDGAADDSDVELGAGGAGDAVGAEEDGGGAGA